MKKVIQTILILAVFISSSFEVRVKESQEVVIMEAPEWVK